MTELGQVLPRLATGMYIPTAMAAALPALGAASADVVAAMQGVTLIAGTCLSLMLTGAIAANAGAGAVEHAATAGGGGDGGGEAAAAAVKKGQVMAARVLVLGMAAELWYLLLGGT